MLKFLGYCITSWLACLCFAVTAHADELTAVELQWLRAGWPVLTYAEQHELPIDIVARPNAAPGDMPLAMGFSNGRCQLVLSMRGNPDAETMLADIPAAHLTAVVEAITAHEVAHCWRHTHGAWHTLPAGFAEPTTDVAATRELAQAKRDMRDTRREEGFADLVGLAWTARQHPAEYTAVHAWFDKIRRDQPVSGSYHDTRVWIALAHDPRAFAPATTPFEQAQGLWNRGLSL